MSTLANLRAMQAILAGWRRAPHVVARSWSDTLLVLWMHREAP